MLLCAARLRIAGSDGRADLRAQLLATLKLLDRLDAGDPGGDPGSGSPAGPLGGPRGFAPIAGCWFNPAAKGRPTRAEGQLAACLFVATSVPAQLKELELAVKAESARAAAMGDAWAVDGREPKKGAWTTGGLVQGVLHRALSPTEQQLLQAAHVVNAEPGVEVEVSQLRSYLARLPKKVRAQLEGPKRDAKGSSSPRWLAALPEILGLLWRRRGELSAAMAQAPTTPPPGRELLEAALAERSVAVEDLRARLDAAQSTARTARTEARVAVEKH